MFISQAVPWRFTFVLVLLNMKSVVSCSDGGDSATLPGRTVNSSVQ